MTDAETPLAELTLRPARSLSRTGFVVVMTILIGFNFVAGIVFFAVGAWPVLGFMGLDVALVWLAFRLNHGTGRRSEHLALYRDRLALTRRDPSGGEQRIDLQPYWLKVEIEGEPGGDGRLLLRSHGRATVVGAFLPPRERADVADWLRVALGALRDSQSRPEAGATPDQPSPSTSLIP